MDNDGHARIGGLGTAFVISATPTADADASFYGAAPELIDPRRWGFTGARATTATDVFAFAVLAWEVGMKLATSADQSLTKWGLCGQVFAGRSLFSEQNVVAGVHLMLNGHRPARPRHPELSRRAWKMIKGSWKSDPATRKKISEVVTILEAEANVHKSK